MKYTTIYTDGFRIQKWEDSRANGGVEHHQIASRNACYYYRIEASNGCFSSCSKAKKITEIEASAICAKGIARGEEKWMPEWALLLAKN